MVLLPLKYLLLRFVVVIYLNCTSSPVKQRKLRQSFALTATPTPTRRRSMMSFSAPSEPSSPEHSSPSRRKSMAARNTRSSFINNGDMSFFAETPSFRDTSTSEKEVSTGGLFWPSTVSRKNVDRLIEKIDIFKMAYDFGVRSIKYSRKAIFRSRPAVWLKLQLHMLKGKLLREDKEDVSAAAICCLIAYLMCDVQGSRANGIASLGGAYAPWRTELTLQSKTKLIFRMKDHTLAELRYAKRYFISEHELVISALDYVLDTGGMMTLCVPYDYDRMYWFLVVLLELVLYVLVGALMKQTATWSDRNLAFLGIDVFFGFLTYFANPYTESMDKWLDFSGRTMIFVICLGLVVNAQLNSDANSAVSTYMYTPWKNISYLTDVVGLTSIYVFIDVAMVVYFYSYIVYVMSILGCFGLIDRIIAGIVYRGHDNVLDFLVFIMERKTFGMENVLSGLEFIQQWDDIIRSQRRYALLTWPDVRPQSLISFLPKIIEIKWAALFNLTLENLRSSLGLTILHTAMFSAQADAARWIIYRNPDLLLAPDSQNDTPITIALKECAYYLSLYGEQNNGALDDGTSYSDEAYAGYYPEVDEIRMALHDHGEFLEEHCTTFHLSSEDILLLRNEGYYKKPTEPDLEQMLVDIANEKLANKPVVCSATRHYDKAVEFHRIKKHKERARIKRSNEEKASLSAKRFPEDDVADNPESANMAVWNVVALTVPQNNVSTDSSMLRYTKQHPDYHYDNYEHPLGVNDLESAAFKPADVMDRLAHSVDHDVQYVVPSKKKIHSVPHHLIVPWDHAHFKMLRDWDCKPRRRKPKHDDQQSDDGSVASTGSNKSTQGKTMVSMKDILQAFTIKEKVDLENQAKWNICRFAELLISDEVAGVQERISWTPSEFKALNKIASVNQGKIAQNLALACHLNPPDGFVRVSDWSMAVLKEMYYERPEEEMNMVVKSVITLMTKTEAAAVTMRKAVNDVGKSMDVRRWKGNRAGLRRRSSRMSGSIRGKKSMRSRSEAEEDEDEHDGVVVGGEEGMLSDRCVHYFAESMVCSRKDFVLDDCELSNNGRRGWRAICRALRRHYSSFILPSVFNPPKPVILVTLRLPRNELDCGDCVYIADIFTHQPTLTYIDLSYNHIGSRGMMRMCKALRNHTNLQVWKLDHNHIGPAAGKDLGLLLKTTKSLRILTLAYNHLGEIHRFPTILSRDSIPSAAHDISTGIKANTSLEQLDLSFNHLGPSLADSLPLAINCHPRIHTLSISGNDLGPEKGTLLLFALAGSPKGAEYARERDKFIAFVKKSQIDKVVDQQASADMARLLDSKEAHTLQAMAEANVDYSEYANLELGQASTVLDSESAIFGDNPLKQPSLAQGSSISLKPKPGQGSKDEESVQSGASLQKASGVMREKSIEQQLSASYAEAMKKVNKPAMNLTSLSIAHNQLGAFSGHAIANILTTIKGLTHLDISGNSLGPIGGERIADTLELLHKVVPRDFLKRVLFEIEESKYSGRNPKRRKKIYTNLVYLQMARNNFGPKVLGSLMVTLATPHCGIISFDISDNPVGLTSQEMAGNAFEASADIRVGLTENKSLISLNFNRTQIACTELVSIFGGLAGHTFLQQLLLQDILFDEPAALQLGNALHHVDTITYLDVRNCRLGPNGGVIIANKLKVIFHRLKYLDISHNGVGPIAAIIIGEGLQLAHCALKTLNFGYNDCLEEGASGIAKALIGNLSITDIDLSGNLLTSLNASHLADAARGLFKNGVKVRDSAFKRFVLNDNPGIGRRGAKQIVKALAGANIQHIEIRNIGAGPGTGELISQYLRDPMVAWSFVDVSKNALTRVGLNQIFWAVRQNKRLRVLRVSENQAGSIFCSDADSLLGHGISVCKAFSTNAVLREVDLSYNSLTSEAGCNVIDAMLENFTIKKLSLRGNLLDDMVATRLSALIDGNEVLEEIDLGRNRMGFTCLFEISTTLAANRRLRVLLLDNNHFGGAGVGTLDSFCRAIMQNYTLQVLNLDGNKLGPEWGMRLAETFARNSALLQVSLRNNRLDVRSGTSLLNAYAFCPYMLELALSADEIGMDLWERMRAVFTEKRAAVDAAGMVEESALSDSQFHLLESYSKSG